MKKIAIMYIILLMMCFAISNTYSQVSVGISVGIAPPVLPVYVQPACPVDGYLWEPGYWAYDDADGYYWVPGVWVAPPEPDYLWTPPYCGYYGFHAGYWGPHIGFYGGINYGGGYYGDGFVGGEWRGGRFRYNTAVVNVNRTVIHNTYVNRTVINNRTVNNRVSFNGPGGVAARPRPQELSAMREHHIQPTPQQISHQQMASRDRNQFAAVNHGRPTATAMNRINGRPFNQHGHVATTSSFGHANAGINRGATGHTANANHQSGFNRPANNGAQRPSQQAHFRQQQPQQQRSFQQAHVNQQARQQQQAQYQQHAQQQAAQHMQQHMQQRVQQNQQQRMQQPRMQPQQHMQQPRMQQQARPQQQPHGNPGPGGGQRHR